MPQSGAPFKNQLYTLIKGTQNNYAEVEVDQDQDPKIMPKRHWSLSSTDKISVFEPGMSHVPPLHVRFLLVSTCFNRLPVPRIPKTSAATSSNPNSFVFIATFGFMGDQQLMIFDKLSPKSSKISMWAPVSSEKGWVVQVVLHCVVKQTKNSKHGVNVQPAYMTSKKMKWMMIQSCELDKLER